MLSYHIYKFSDYSSVQHAVLQTASSSNRKAKRIKERIRDDRRGWAAVRYSSCQAGTASEECVGENNNFSGGTFTVDVVVVLFGLKFCVFVYCTIPESMEACFLVVLGGGGGGVLLGRGGGMCCK